MIWTICGAGRSVGKTTVAQSIAAILEASVYCKCGHNAPKAGKPGNYFLGLEDLSTFIDNAADRYTNIVVESNIFVYSGRPDVIVYIDGITGITNFRDDAPKLKAAADIVIYPNSTVANWKKILSQKISDSTLVDALCKIFWQHHQWLFATHPKICSKVWFEAGGEHVFGAGLARLLENIDTLGTLQAAAVLSGMSYRYAWDLIKTAEKHLHSSLIERHAGSTGGGGSVLSAKGRSMLASFRQINNEVAKFADQRFSQLSISENINPQIPIGILSDEVLHVDGFKTDQIKKAIVEKEIIRVSFDGGVEKENDSIVAERAITVMIDKVGSFTIMCTPCDIEALAVGFIFSESIITDIHDIVSITIKDSMPDVVGIVVNDPGRLTVQRNLIVASSCGMCGVRNVDKMLESMPQCGNTLTLTVETISKAVENLHPRQEIFRITGGSHAAAIFDADANIVAFGEDIGRHSVLDKAIGKCILSSTKTKAMGAVLSGRVSLEMVTKAAKAGIEVIAAVSAPSSFAVEAAKKWNITLCGFARNKRFNVYTHPERIVDLL